MTFIPTSLVSDSTAQSAVIPLSATPSSLGTSSSNTGGLSFSDIIDTVNPLQHIPLVSGLYRALSGNTISPAAQIAGDTLYGALTGGTALIGAATGLATSSADVALTAVTGSSISQHIAATLVGNDGISDSVPASAPSIGALAQLPVSNSDTSLTYAQAEYQRMQAFDNINKKLVQMVA